VHSPVRAFIESAAIRHNLGRVREFAPRTRVMAVIKANAYGHGLVAAAKALAAADGLAVARLDEGLVLRAAGLSQRILLLEGVLDADELALAAQQRLDVMVHGVEQLAMLEQRAGEPSLAAWLKIDTGMNRLGFRAEQFGEVRSRMARIGSVAPDPVLVTHLASADETADGMTPAQLRTFASATAGAAGERSIANSAAILAWPDAHADWVRPGLMLYGVSPFADGLGADLGLRPAMTLRSKVIALKTVRAGETVGYGGAWQANRDTRMVVAAAGYGDGYPRSARSGTPVLVNGRRAPLIGRVSMDMITVDVTDLPAVTVGDPVVLWGEGLPVEEVARCADAIPYQLLCGVSQRVAHEFC
jgi:alanine racemase